MKMTAYQLHLSLAIHRAEEAGFKRLAAMLVDLLQQDIERTNQLGVTRNPTEISYNQGEIETK